jgi:DnaK suppressor protein
MAIDTELFRKLLEDERQHLEDELARIGTPTDVKGSYTTKFDEVGSDDEDNAVEMTEYVDASALENELEEKLNQVYEALAKIEAGNYGICESCHEPIAPARLKAYPAATTCVKHA